MLLQKWLRKIGSMSINIKQGNLCNLMTSLENAFVVELAVIGEHNRMKLLPLVNWSITTRIVDFPDNNGRQVMKL